MNSQRLEPDGCENSIQRLKHHLIEVEERYTQEILQLEELNSTLNQKIEELNNKFKQFNQNDSKLKQCQTERDSLANQLSLCEDRAQQYSASINNLQLVIEQIQKENERKLEKNLREKSLELEKEREKARDLNNRVLGLELQLEESLLALGAAQRLSRAIDVKDVEIERQKREALNKDKLIEELKQEVNDLKEREESKVDKQVIKGLIIGFFLTPEDRKHEVKRLLARILDFNQQEMQKTGIHIGRKKAPSNDESLSEKFVKFLELESKRETSSSGQSGVDQQLARDLIQDKRNPFLSEEKNTEFFKSILIQKK